MANEIFVTVGYKGSKVDVDLAFGNLTMQESIRAQALMGTSHWDDLLATGDMLRPLTLTSLIVAKLGSEATFDDVDATFGDLMDSMHGPGVDDAVDAADADGDADGDGDSPN